MVHRLNVRRASAGLLRRQLHVGACLLIFAAACRTDTAPATPTKHSLTIGMSLPSGTAGTPTARLVKDIKVEAPVATAPDGRPAGRVFDTWRWLEDGVALELHLRPGVLFHDGTPLTSRLAADVIRGEFAAGSAGIISTVDSVVATDDAHVVIRTRRREGFLLADLSTIDLALPGKPGVGTGPFKGADRPDELVAFDGYYLGKPTIERVQIKEYPTQRAAWTALLRGEIDFLHDVSKDAVDFVDVGSSVRTYSFLRPYYDAIVFNQRHPVLAKREVRQALNLAVDKAAVLNSALRKHGEVAYDPIWPFHWAYVRTQPEASYSPDRAMQLLDSAGVRAGTGRRGSAPLSRFQFQCLILEGDQRFEAIALLVQRQLAAIGVDMEVVPAPLRAIEKALGSGKFDAALMEFIGSRSLNWAYVFWRSPQPGGRTLMNSGYTAADAALDRFRGATQDEEIRAAVAELQRVLHDDPPAMFLDWQQRTRALSDAFSAPQEGGDILGTLGEWQPVTPGSAARR
jgi:peptide/nickel transport system substrate-binding protein